MRRTPSRQAPISSPKRCRPTSAGSGNIPSSASWRAAGWQPAVPVGCCCARRRWKRPNAGSPRGRAVRRSRPRRRKLSSPRSRRGTTRRRNSSPEALPPASSSRSHSLGWPTGNGKSRSSSGRSPNSNASAPKIRSRRRPRPPTLWCSTWHSGSAPRKEFPPVSSKTSSIGRTPCRISSSNPDRRRRSSGAARPEPSPTP